MMYPVTLKQIKGDVLNVWLIDKQDTQSILISFIHIK